MEPYDPRAEQQRTWDVVAAVDDVAKRHGASMEQVALAWLLDRPGVSSVLLGA